MNDDVQEYTLWINQTFHYSWKEYRVNDLIYDISCGIILIHLTNTLCYFRLPVLQKDPWTVNEREENVLLSLETLKTEGVKLNGINARDIAEGNVEIILSLCCFLKRHFSSWKLLRGHQILDRQFIPSTSHKGYRKDYDALPDLTISQFDNLGLNGIDYLDLKRKNIVARNDVSADALSSPISSNNIEASSSVRKFEALINGRYSNAQMSSDQLSSTLYTKEDILLFEWVSHVTGFNIADYSSFEDGTVLFELVNRIVPRKLSSKIFHNITSHDQLQLILDTLYYELNIDTIITPEAIMNQILFNEFSLLLATLKQLHENSAQFNGVEKTFKVKQVTWDSNTYLKIKSREIYKTSGDINEKSIGSWVHEIKDFVPSLLYDETDFTAHDPKLYPKPRTFQNSSISINNNEVVDDRITFSNSSVRNMKASIDNVNTKLKTLPRLSTNMVTEDIAKKYNQTSQFYSPVGINSKPWKKREVLVSKEEKEAEERMATSFSLSCYTPPRWSQILREELQYAAEFRENNKIINRTKDTSFMEKNSVAGNKHSEVRNKFDEEIAAVFDRDYMVSDDCFDKTEERLETNITNSTGRLSTPFFIPEFKNLQTSETETVSFNSANVSVAANISVSSTETIDHKITENHFQDVIRESSNGTEELAQLPKPLSPRKKKWMTVTEMVRAQSKSPAGLLQDLND